MTDVSLLYLICPLMVNLWKISGKKITENYFKGRAATFMDKRAGEDSSSSAPLKRLKCENYGIPITALEYVLSVWLLFS